ncbi:hypothetical protein Mycch_1337 [Mycolicibacterium chubuense NBB4]|uniref:Uncharacterized protein n=2 Tax=Mycolicibacterium chubuense TaxID=1800 RepID=I4BFT2_MYCCN|nr:hypothetical protein Mycch_1337 [Mycolicibacterium chubuense NBB4]
MRRAWREWRFQQAEVLRAIGYVFLAALILLTVFAVGYALTHQ